MIVTTTTRQHQQQLVNRKRIENEQDDHRHHLSNNSKILKKSNKIIPAITAAIGGEDEDGNNNECTPGQHLRHQILSSYQLDPPPLASISDHQQHQRVTVSSFTAVNRKCAMNRNGVASNCIINLNRLL